jgi:uncharacterized OsmC-like protein
MNLSIAYRDGFLFEAQVRGHMVPADQPASAGGGDAGPTPGEYLVISLGTCIGTYVAAHCRKLGLPIEGMKLDVEWEKASSPARISEIRVKIRIPGRIPEEKRAGILAVAGRCLVHNTLQTPPEVLIDLDSEAMD